jgi:ComF family protein
MPSVKEIAASGIKRIGEFFIPPLCIICDKPVGSDKWFCADCRSALIANHTSREACPRCSLNRQKRECACEFAWDFPFEKVFSAYDYDDTVSSIAQHIKYQGKSQLAYHVGFITAPLLPRDFFTGIDFIVPVPLHKARKKRRGYNQAEFFARGIIKGLGGDPGILRIDLLKRVKNTVTQTQLDREDRQKNLENAFAVNPEKVTELKDKTVILVDDILTTGATTEACPDGLIRAGCAAVRVLSMGRD